ncbi:DUF5671 domain-containing protein, partial [Chloroflexota bacterium]
RKLYLNFITTVAGLVSLHMAVVFLGWLLAGVPRDKFPFGELATLVVTISIWAYHWRTGDKEGHPSPAARTLRRWYIYILSSWGLVALVYNMVLFLSYTFLHLPFWGSSVVSGGFWNSSLQINTSWILAGGSAWVFHWFGMAKDDADSTLHQVYLYLLTILGSTIAWLTGLTTTLYAVIRFISGGLDVSIGIHFRSLTWTIPTMLVAVAVWVYHQQVIGEEAGGLVRRGFSARRVLFYLMSFISLGTSIAGLIMLFGLILELMTNAFGSSLVAVTPNWWRQPLSLSIALLIVGIPLWMYYWSRVLRMVTGGGVTEGRARSRRTFLYVVVAVAIITLAADLVNIVYQLLNGILQSKMGMEVFRNLQWSFQTVIVAIPVLFYHWRVLRQDHVPAEEKLAVPKSVTLLSSEPGAELVSRIEDRVGSRITRLRFLGQSAGDLPTLSEEELDKLVSDIQAAPGDKVMLVAAEGKIMVLPYQEP